GDRAGGGEAGTAAASGRAAASGWNQPFRGAETFCQPPRCGAGGGTGAKPSGAQGGGGRPTQRFCASGGGTGAGAESEWICAAGEVCGGNILRKVWIVGSVTRS